MWKARSYRKSLSFLAAAVFALTGCGKGEDVENPKPTIETQGTGDAVQDEKTNPTNKPEEPSPEATPRESQQGKPLGEVKALPTKEVLFENDFLDRKSVV